MRRTSFFTPLLALVGLLNLTGCWSRESPVAQGNQEQVLHRGLGADVAELDPHIVTGLPELNVLSALFEGLVAEDPHDLHPVPGVAKSWEVSLDQLRYTFHLRADARWSNGDSVTAQDFVNSIRRVLTPSLGADYASMLYVVQNAEAYHKGELNDFTQVGVAATDAHTLIITLDHQTPHFLTLLSHPIWYPVHLPTLEKSGAIDQRGNPWTRPETIVSNGPFKLAEWKRDRVIIVEKSSTYWDATTVRLNAIHFHPNDSVNSEERAYRAGQLHITEALPVSKVAPYRRDHPEVLRINPFLDTYFLRLNVTRPQLNNPLIRRALSLAIDRDSIVKNVTKADNSPHTVSPHPAPPVTNRLTACPKTLMRRDAS